MSTSSEDEYKEDPNYLRIKAALLVLLSTAILCVVILNLSDSTVGKDINYRLGNTVDFRMREWLGKGPKIDPRLKIFGFDDKTLGHTKQADLYADQWIDLLVKIAAQKPKIVVVDKMFSLPEDPNKRIGEALERLRTLGTTVVVGSFSAPFNLKHRTKLDVNKKYFHLPFIESQGIKPSQLDRDFYHTRALSEVDFKNNSLKPPMYSYGPIPELQKNFHWVGHIKYHGFGRVSPLVRMKRDFAVLHTGLYASDHIGFRDGLLRINDKPIFTDKKGQLVVNILGRDELKNKEGEVVGKILKYYKKD